MEQYLKYEKRNPHWNRENKIKLTIAVTGIVIFLGTIIICSVLF